MPNKLVHIIPMNFLGFYMHTVGNSYTFLVERTGLIMLVVLCLVRFRLNFLFDGCYRSVFDTWLDLTVSYRIRITVVSRGGLRQVPTCR